MKRVLNSGSIKLPYVEGSEQGILNTVKDMPLEEGIKLIYNCTDRLNILRFTFEIKAPVIILQTLQNTHLGALSILDEQDHQTAYTPASFYKSDALEFIPMDSKECNEMNTKLNNFYNWSLNFYNKLIQNGLCKEQAQLVLSQGMFTNFLWDINAKDLIAFIEDNYNKSPELYGYCGTFVLYLEEHLPSITKWLKQNMWQDFNL
jgi:hypothetical protein